MALRINTNVTALNTHKNLVVNDERLSGSIEKLSSGLRINRASDDAAGLTISEKLRTQVKGLTRAILNVQDGISMIQTAEGALNETHSMLQRMRELAIQSSNDTLTTTDRLEIQKEISQLKEDINRISYGTEFNTKKLLDGSATAQISTSDPTNLEGVPTGEVLTFSDFSILVYPQTVTVNGQQKVMTGSAQVNRSAIFVRTDGQVASATTTLQSLSNFYDKNGTFILELPQTLYLQGDNHQGKMVISKDITVSQLAQRIQDSMNHDQLGVGLQFEGSTAVYSQTGETNGQLTMTSGKMGSIGRINVTGEEELVKALGFQQVIAPEDPIYSIAATNLALPVGSRTTNTLQIAGHRAAGLIAGIDLVFQPPTSAFVSTKTPDVGISIAGPGITFDLADSVPGTASASITIISGNFSMSQIVNIINSAIATVPGLRISAALNSDNQVVFNSTNTGSGAWVQVATTLPTPNVLGIGDGYFYGSGGYAGNANAIAPFANYTSAISFELIDSHTGLLNTVNLAAHSYAGGITSMVDALNANAQMAALKIQAVDNFGTLQLKSLETGTESNFQIISALASLQINAQVTINGYDGNPASQAFMYDTTSSKYGYVLADNGIAPADDLAFFVGDLDGRGMNITVSAGTTAAAGDTFKTVNSIINLINTGASSAAGGPVKVNAELNPDNSIKIYSTTPGKDGKVVLAELGGVGDINTLQTALGLEAKATQNGVGNYQYKMHVKDAFVMFQVGPNEGQFAKANMIRCDTIALGINDIDLTNTRDSQKAIGLLDKAIQYVSSERAKLGAVENRMVYTQNSLRVGLENMSASESRIRDVDMASEVVNMTKYQVMTQASNAMLAQANATSKSVLDLLR